MNEQIKLIAAAYTPMNPDGALNPDIIDLYAEKLRSDGLDGVLICGTTGEGVLLTIRERFKVAERWADNTGKGFLLNVHVGSSNYSEACELARHAQDIGAQSITTMGPGPITPGRIEELVDYCEKVASAAPDLDFYYYHMPVISHIDFSMFDFLNKANNRIPNLKGLKFTDNNLLEMLQCALLQDNKFEILNGFDEILLAGLTMGASGAVGSTYNYMSSIYKKIITAFVDGNIEEARKWQLFANHYIRIMNRYHGTLTAGKKMLLHWDLDLGPSRTPVRNLTETEKQSYFNELNEMKFFEIVSNTIDPDDMNPLYDELMARLDQNGFG